MEPAIIDWKKETANFRYVRDEVYENISCPRWADLSNPDAIPVDDEAWFCRPDCRHPKTAEDFKRWTPSPSHKYLRSSSEKSPLVGRSSGNKNSASGDAALKRRGVSPPAKVKASPKKTMEDLESKESYRDAASKRRGVVSNASILASPPLKTKASPRKFTADLENKETHKDAALKRRGGTVPSSPAKPKAAPKRFHDDLENKDPNNVTPPKANRQLAPEFGRKAAKEAIKSSAEKKEGGRGQEVLEQKKPLLRSTMSARNLFSGRDILGQISEFCNELKRMAMRKDKIAAETEPKKDEEKKEVLKEVVEEDQGSAVQKTVQNLNQNSKNEGSIKKSSKVPLRIETGRERWKMGGDDKVLREVRANPPTPQRFSPMGSSHPRKARVAATTTSSPLNKPPKYVTREKGMLQEIAPNEDKGSLIVKPEGCNKNAIAHDMEGRDMFWFFKPCSSYLV